LDLFAAVGFDATTVDQIAERAQVGRRTFFHYFPTKEAVLFGDITERGETMLQALTSAPPDDDPFHSLLAATRMMLDIDYDLERAKRIAGIVEANPVLLQRNRALVRGHFESDVVGVLQARYPAHSELELRTLNGVVFAAVQAAMAVYITEPEPGLRSYFDDAVSYLIAGIERSPTMEESR
jgi:AcrR family transcriptional regulator